MADPVGDIIGDQRAFVAQQRDRLLARDIDNHPYPLSHLAFRVPEWDQYVHVRTLLLVLLQSGRIDLDWLITHRTPLDEADAAGELLTGTRWRCCSSRARSDADTQGRASSPPTRPDPGAGSSPVRPPPARLIFLVLDGSTSADGRQRCGGGRRSRRLTRDALTRSAR